MKKFKVLLLVVSMFMFLSCSSSSNTPTGEAVVPDYSAIAQEILPVLATASSGSTSTVYSTKAIDFDQTFPEEYPSIEDMIYNTLSTDPTLGSSSIFITIDNLQTMFSAIADQKGFPADCVLPTDLTGTATKLNSGEILVVPYVGNIAVVESYECLILLPDIDPRVHKLSYAFGTSENADGDLYVSHLVFSMFQVDGGTSSAKAIYNEDTGTLDYEYYGAYEYGDQEMGVKSIFSGVVEPTSFNYQSTYYYAPEVDDTCPDATDPETTARKLVGNGSSASAFIIGAQRTCESPKEYIYCMDDVTKDIAGDDSVCVSYEAGFEDLTAIPASDVPHGYVTEFDDITVK